MFRTIAAAAIVFGFAAFALRQSAVMGPLEEPLLLLFMGTLFLVVGKLFSAPRKVLDVEPEPAPQLIERRA
jgi:predicted Co/Zn/Cd cation transporter (cation efflux family)